MPRLKLCYNQTIMHEKGMRAEWDKDDQLKIAAVSAPVRLQVVQTLRKAILQGRFAPGDRLVEKDLCELMGVSRTSIREAFRQLESEGIIENVPNRGPIVAMLSRAQAKEVYEVRQSLEALVAKLFALNATEKQVAELGEATEALASAYRSGDVDEILLAKDTYYGVLYSGCGNAVARQMLTILNARINLLRRVSLSAPGRLDKSLREMRRLMAAIQKRDGDAAWSAASDHVQNAAEAALAQLEKAS
jgi:GntR family transcriptional regulator, trigonelline degradation regulator